MKKPSRYYQDAIVKEIPIALAHYEHVIVQSPTGSGKSFIISQTVKKIIASGKTPLVLSDGLKIHSQLVEECGAFPIVSQIKSVHVLEGQSYVAMSQTLMRRNAILDQFKILGNRLVLIIDECHRGTMNSIIDYLLPKWLLGFSATPHWRLAKHLEKYYKYLIQGCQIKQLQADSFLVHYQHTIRTGADLSKLKEGSSGDYTEESQDQVFGGKRMYDGLFTDLPNFHKKKTVIYVASIKLCEQIYQECLLHGYKACRYHSGLPNGDVELKKFTTTHECDICVSVSALTLGWDFPPIDGVVLWRATTSLALYLQINGRGSRPCSVAEYARWGMTETVDKKYFWVLDYGGNYQKFGAWNMDRDWTELWKPQKRKITTYAGVVGSKECPVCGYLMPVSSRVCPNCGYMYSEVEMRLVQGQLVEVENSMRNIENRNVGTFTAKELADYAKLKDKRQHAIRIAKSMEQKQPGYLREFAALMGYKRGWVDRMIIDIGKYKNKISFYDSVVK